MRWEVAAMVGDGLFILIPPPPPLSIVGTDGPTLSCPVVVIGCGWQDDSVVLSLVGACGPTLSCLVVRWSVGGPNWLRLSFVGGVAA